MKPRPKTTVMAKDSKLVVKPYKENTGEESSRKNYRFNTQKNEKEYVLCHPHSQSSLSLYFENVSWDHIQSPKEGVKGKVLPPGSLN